MLFGLKKFVSFWLMPLPLCLTLLLVGLGLLLFTRRAKLARGLVVVGTLLLMLFSNKFVSQELVRPLEAVYPAIPELPAGAPLPARLSGCRFVVLLGGGSGNDPDLSANNQLSSSALARLTEATRILYALPQARLIATGPGDRNHPEVPSNAEFYVRAAMSLGIDRDRTTINEDGNDTEEEALAIKRLVGSAPFIVVTSAWHMPRTMALFHNAGLAPIPCPADFSARRGETQKWTAFLWDTGSLERSTWAVRERIGYLWIWLRGRT